MNLDLLVPAERLRLLEFVVSCQPVFAASTVGCRETHGWIRTWLGACRRAASIILSPSLKSNRTSCPLSRRTLRVHRLPRATGPFGWMLISTARFHSTVSEDRRRLRKRPRSSTVKVPLPVGSGVQKTEVDVASESLLNFRTRLQSRRRSAQRRRPTPLKKTGGPIAPNNSNVKIEPAPAKEIICNACASPILVVRSEPPVFTSGARCTSASCGVVGSSRRRVDGKLVLVGVIPSPWRTRRRSHAIMPAPAFCGDSDRPGSAPAERPVTLSSASLS